MSITGEGQRLDVGLNHGEVLAALLHALIDREGGSVTVSATDFWVAAATVKRGTVPGLRICHQPDGQITFRHNT
jgi:hypothetical protein